MRHVSKYCATELKLIAFYGSDNAVFVMCYHAFGRVFWKTVSTHVCYIQTLSGLQNKESCKHVAYSKNRRPTAHNENDEDKNHYS